MPTIILNANSLSSIDTNFFGKSQKDQVNYFNRNFKVDIEKSLEEMTNEEFSKEDDCFGPLFNQIDNSSISIMQTELPIISRKEYLDTD